MSRFDKNIKNKLEGYASPVNSDMWSKISSNLPPQEQTNTRSWWLPILGVAVVLIGAFGLYFGGDFNFSDEAASNSQLVLENNINPNNYDGLSDDIKVKNPKTVSNNNNPTEFNQLKSQSNKEKINSRAADVTLATGQSTLSNKPNQNIFIDNNTSDNQNLTSTTKKSDIQVEKNETTDLASNQKETANAVSLYKQYDAIINKTKELKDTEEALIVERSEEISINRLDFSDFNVQSLNNDTRFQLPREKLVCPSFSDLRFGVFAEAYFSNDFGMRTLSYNGPVGEADYLNIRNDTEQSKYSFSAGARFTFMLPSGFGAKTGINYSQINETFKFQDPASKQTKKFIIKEYQWENGVIIDSTEVTKEIEIPGKLTLVNQNKYKVIGLPILFTYEWGHKKRLYYSVTAGPMFNIRFTQKGKFLNPETLSPVDFSTTDGNYKAFTTNIGTSMYMSFALNYQLGNGMDIFVEPSVRYFLKDATINTYLLNQKYTILGLGFGVKYKL